MTNTKILTAVIPNVFQVDMRLDRVLAKLFFEYSRTYLKKCILNRQICINGIVFNKPNIKVSCGDIVTVKIISNANINHPQDIPLNIIYEDNDILIIDKPDNLVVHPGAGHKDGTLLNGLLYKSNKFINVPRSGIVHRLDKNTTGLMVIAKNIFSYNTLIRSMKSREIIRQYEAIVHGKMISGGSISFPIKRHSSRRTIMTIGIRGREAITHYRIIKRFSFCTHLMVKLETGRTHQIRVHMLNINHPLIGDREYGNKYKYCRYINSSTHNIVKNFPRQALHASKLLLKHPRTCSWMEWNSSIPEDILNLLNHLNKNNV
ncbi:MAG: 23S rRNA pseudouridine(1911/1915/1917) synthase RluD [Buchnera aphidicola (Nurudea yanoniella)]